ncbi:MAG: M15 family metallopeptidase [Clostridia bacterium]|nr:M15 family metallopeptidase [Clostridia bacterium]
MPVGFVYVNEIIPDIMVDAKYYTGDNFLGRKVDGYESNTAVMTYETAIALKAVQENLLKLNLSLVVFDAYRPQMAVDDFVNWVNDTGDVSTKEIYYPFIEKSRLIEYGYIASLSGHSKGNTVDVSIVDLKTGKLLDMGTRFDYFGEASHYTTQSVTEEQFNNRKLLRESMMINGFSPYENEWWHFSYQPTEYSNSDRFNFIVKY